MGSSKTLSNRKWKASHVETWGMQLPKGAKQIIKRFAEERGMTPSSYVIRLIEADNNVSLAQMAREEHGA